MGTLQPTLFDKPLPFSGVTYEPDKDERRLTNYFQAIKKIMLTGEWFTLRELCEKVGCLETSASARIRDLRKPAFGGYTIERERVGGGLFRYRLKQ